MSHGFMNLERSGGRIIMPLPNTEVRRRTWRLRPHLRARHGERGVAALEFSLLLPMAVVLMLGTLQAAQVLIAQRELLGAAQTGARAGSAFGSTTAQVKSAVTTFLSSSTIGEDHEVVIAGVGSDSTGDTLVTVTVKHEFPLMLKIPAVAGWESGTLPLEASVTFRHE
jgi:Flp pilus assembly protein TadG